MSFLSKLKIENDEMNVLDCSFEFSQEADYNGRPAEKTRGGQIKLLIESTSKTEFLDWVISSEMIKDGVITFYNRDSMSSQKTLNFTGAYCLFYKEHFNMESEQPMLTTLVISAKEIKIKNITFKNNWPSN